MLKILKISFLYIGTIIGAGFATGKEINSYFGQTSIFTLILGGICLGLFAGYYLYLGKVFSEDLSKIAFKKYNKVFDILVGVSTFFVFVSMFDTSDIILYEMAGIRYGGYLTILFTLFCAVIGISFIKKINFLVIPSIIIMVIVIFSKAPQVDISGKISVLSPIMYSGMNIMLAGYIIKPEGKNLTNKDIVLTTIITSVVFSFIMVLLYEIVKCDSSIMPLFTVAKKYNLDLIAGIIIYLAIITTALSSESICIDYLMPLVKNPFLVVVFLFLLAIPFKIYVGFDNIVNFIYPVVSILGVLVTITSMITLIKYKRNQKNKNLYTK